MWEGRGSFCFSIYFFYFGIDCISAVREKYGTYRLRHIPSFLILRSKVRSLYLQKVQLLSLELLRQMQGKIYPFSLLFKCSS